MSLSRIAEHQSQQIPELPESAFCIALVNALCGKLGIKVGETTPDGSVTLEAVTCLAACDKAPMFQTQGPDGIKYHENMTVDRTMELIGVLRRSGREVGS